MKTLRWTTRLVAVAALTVALAAPASAQVFVNRGPVFVQPQVMPVPGFVNPWANAWFNPWMGVNPWAVNPWFANPSPPLAVRQAGLFWFRGPDLYVNPYAGTVVRPLTGVTQFRDGSTFYRVPGTGVVNAFGQLQPGTETYYNPRARTYYNPNTGLVVRPGGW